MSRIISTLLLAVAAAISSAAIAAEPATDPLKLAPNAPTTYVVVKGDTLWDIAGRFLEKPWRWPEIWGLNKPQIKNPHRIYPGNVIVLDLSGGDPRLRIAKRLTPEVHAEPVEKEIPSIPVHIIAPFISQPLIVGENELQNAPVVISTPESRVMAGNGDDIFVRGLVTDEIKWHVYRPGTAIKNPRNNEVLAYEAVFLGTAEVTQRGEIAILKVVSAKEEIQPGNLLIPAEEPSLAPYMPHTVTQDIDGVIVSVHGGVSSGGKDSVIAINLGAQDGIEKGHVLGLFTHRSTVYKGESIKLPELRYGIAFVFRVFDHVAYALVMESERPITLGDSVKNP
ncbi:MAG: LysM peptidoglycan-binding domain-containing protein [Zoogloeaceae bacterium]|jgi:hypothetical protein|nr:LysM peptidoglycan-binding domain-containing protein [Zoogloeaceae bacterium]